MSNFISENKNDFILLVVSLLISFPFQKIIFSTIFSKIIVSVSSSSTDKQKKKQFNSYLALYVCLQLLVRCVNYISTGVENRLSPKFYQYIRMMLLNAKLKKFENETSKSLNKEEEMIKFQDIQSIFEDFFFILIQHILPDFLTILVIFFFYLSISPLYALCFLGTELLNFAALYLYKTTFVKKKR